MSKIENTSKNPRRDWLFGANPNAIEHQEAEGQKQLAKSSQLPTRGLNAEVAALHGIEIIGQTEGDPIFTDVKLPDGWKIVPTEHSMWSDLVDASGKTVAGIFYKAAFYDRSANIMWND